MRTRLLSILTSVAVVFAACEDTAPEIQTQEETKVSHVTITEVTLPTFSAVSLDDKELRPMQWQHILLEGQMTIILDKEGHTRETYGTLFPTDNLQSPQDLRLPFGVYACRSWFGGDEDFTNLLPCRIGRSLVVDTTAIEFSFEAVTDYALITVSSRNTASVPVIIEDQQTYPFTGSVDIKESPFDLYYIYVVKGKNIVLEVDFKASFSIDEPIPDEDDVVTKRYSLLTESNRHYRID